MRMPHFSRLQEEKKNGYIWEEVEKSIQTYFLVYLLGNFGDSGSRGRRTKFHWDGEKKKGRPKMGVQGKQESGTLKMFRRPKHR